MSVTLTHSLNTLARSAGLRGTMLHFSGRTLPAVIRSYDPINLGAGDQPYTVEAWIRASATQSPPGGTTLVPILSWSWKDVSRDPYPFAIYLNNRSAGDIRPKVVRQRSDGTTESVEATVSVGDGLFHHVALVRRLLNSTQAYLQVYVDGETDPTWVVVSDRGTDASAIEGSLFTVGGGLIQISNQDPVFSGFNGDICQVRVWSGALSGTQISALRYEALLGPIEVLDAEGGQASGTVTFAANTIAGTVVATAEGVQYATIEDGASGHAYTAVARVPGPTGNAASGAVNTVVSVPYGAVATTVSSSGAFRGGSDPYGGEAATGQVTLTNSGGTAFSAPLGFQVQVGATGPVFALTSAGTVNASGGTASFFVRAVSVGIAGNVTANAINTVSFPNLADGISVSNSQQTSGGVDPVAPDAANYSTGLITVTNRNGSRAVTLPAGTVVGVSQGGTLSQDLLYALVSQVIIPAGGTVTNVLIQAVFPGSDHGTAAGTINWVSPIYLGPSDSVTVTNPMAIASVPPRLIRLVGCWPCDEGFGRVVYNYASNSNDPDSQGNGAFDQTILGAYSLSALGALPSDVGDPEWVITTLMAPPPFVS